MDQPERPVYTIQAARQAIQVLIESQDAIGTTHLRAMERLEQELDNLHTKSLKQSTLDKWIM